MKATLRSASLQIFALAILAIALPSSLRAQFKQPSPEELSMISDAKAPGADAVVLDYSDITDDEMHVRTVYERIKVLTEKGKIYATVDSVYALSGYRVDDIKARTIHSDGTVIPLEGKPEEILMAKGEGYQMNRKVLNLPSVEVGSIIEYRIKWRNDEFNNYDHPTYSSPHWQIQRPLFIHKAHYSFVPFRAFQKNRPSVTAAYLTNYKGEPLNTLIYVSKLPPGIDVKIDSQNTFSLDLTDIPAVPNEDHMPPERNYLYQLEFYYSPAHNAKDYWATESKDWTKNVDRFADHDNSIKQVAASLITPADSELVKAQKIYKAVQSLDNTDFSRVKSKAEMRGPGFRNAKRAEDTWNQKSGSREDITLLYLALLRAAGLQAYDMKVVNRNRGVFDYGYLFFEQLDDDLVLAKIDGKETLLDPGEKMCSFGRVHWKHSGATGFRQSDAGPATASTPPSSYKDNTLVRSGELTLDESGAVTGTINYVMTGQRALQWRQLALTTDVDELKKQFDHELRKSVPSGVQAHVDHFLSLDDPASPLLAIVNVSGNYGTSTPKRILLPGYFFGSHGSHPFVEEANRQTPVDMQYAEQVQDTIVLNLPQHYTIESTPQPSSDSWAGHAIFTTQVQHDADSVTLTRTLARAFTLAKPEEYQDLRSFYLKAETNDQQQLTLVRSDPSSTPSK